MIKEMENRGHIKRYSRTDIVEYLNQKHGTRYNDYRQKWEAAGKGELIPEKPLYFFIELTSYCNLSCKMCYHSLSNKNKVIYNMPMDVIDNMVQQCKDLEIPSIVIGSGAECLLHPEIKTIIKKFKDIGIIDFFVITNGVKLNEDISSLLIDLEIERLQISLDAASPETYKKIRGANLDLIEKNIYAFLKLREQRKAKLPFLRVSFVKQSDNIHEVNSFFDKWKDKADIIDYQDFIDFNNVDSLKTIGSNNFICPDPFQRIGISWNGDIYPCCSFYQKHLKLGNIKDMTLLEAWNSDKLSSLRHSFNTEKVPLACKNCYGALQYQSNNVEELNV